MNLEYLHLFDFYGCSFSAKFEAWLLYIKFLSCFMLLFFLYPLKTLENERFSDVLRKYRKTRSMKWLKPKRWFLIFNRWLPCTLNYAAKCSDSNRIVGPSVTSSISTYFSYLFTVLNIFHINCTILFETKLPCSVDYALMTENKI